MSDDFPSGENVVFCAAADVVNDQGPALRICFVGDNPGVIQPVIELPLHDVARLPLVSSTRIDLRRQSFSKALEENCLVGNAPLVDVGVGASVAPLRGIRVWMTFFVFVNQLLQVESNGAQRANNYIGASAPTTRNIAASIF